MEGDVRPLWTVVLLVKAMQAECFARVLLKMRIETRLKTGKKTSTFADFFANYWRFHPKSL